MITRFYGLSLRTARLQLCLRPPDSKSIQSGRHLKIRDIQETCDLSDVLSELENENVCLDTDLSWLLAKSLSLSLSFSFHLVRQEAIAEKILTLVIVYVLLIISTLLGVPLK